MHGIAEALALYGFIGTFLVAVAVQRLGRPRSMPLLVLLALWPLLLTFVIDKSILDRPLWWGYWAFLGLMAGATALGASFSAWLSGRRIGD